MCMILGEGYQVLTYHVHFFLFFIWGIRIGATMYVSHNIMMRLGTVKSSRGVEAITHFVLSRNSFWLESESLLTGGGVGIINTPPRYFYHYFLTGKLCYCSTAHFFSKILCVWYCMRNFRCWLPFFFFFSVLGGLELVQPCTVRQSQYNDAFTVRLEN